METVNIGKNLANYCNSPNSPKVFTTNVFVSINTIMRHVAMYRIYETCIVASYIV